MFLEVFAEGFGRFWMLLDLFGCFWMFLKAFGCFLAYFRGHRHRSLEVQMLCRVRKQQLQVLSPDGAVSNLFGEGAS